MSRVECVLPVNAEKAATARRILATSLAAYGLSLDRIDAYGRVHRAVVSRRTRMTLDEFEQRLASAQKEAAERAQAYRLEGFALMSSS